MYNCLYCKREIKLKDFAKAKKVRCGDLHQDCCDKEMELVFVCLPEDNINGFYDLKENVQLIIDSMEIDESFIFTKVEMKAEDFYNLPEFDGF